MRRTVAAWHRRSYCTRQNDRRSRVVNVDSLLRMMQLIDDQHLSFGKCNFITMLLCSFSCHFYWWYSRKQMLCRLSSKSVSSKFLIRQRFTFLYFVFIFRIMSYHYHAYKHLFMCRAKYIANLCLEIYTIHSHWSLRMRVLPTNRWWIRWVIDIVCFR